MKYRPTLGQVFFLSISSLALLLGGLFYALLTGSQRAIVETTTSLRDSASERVAKRVEDYLRQADQVADKIERQIRSGKCPIEKIEAVESCLFAALLTNVNLAEIDLTRATKLGYDAHGQAELAADKWQVSVFRDRAQEESRVCTRYTHPDADRFMAELRCRTEQAVLLPVPRSPGLPVVVTDPTQHLTFSTPASAPLYGTLLRSDLSYSELDEALPEPQRRVVVTVMKAIEDARGEFIGVLRAGLLEQQIDAEVAQIKVNHEKDDPYRIFLCDDDGRLVTRLSSGDGLRTVGGDLRVDAAGRLPHEIAAALGHPARSDAAKSGAEAHGEFLAEGRRYFVSFRPLKLTQGWNVGIVGPADYYLKSLRDSMRTLLGITLAVVAIVLVGGVITLRTIRSGLAQIEGKAKRMHSFDFAAAPTESPFRDVSVVLEAIEQTKTAMRAMGKYVPIDLVREFYEKNREPTLGGQLATVSLMFTDIKDFTVLAERLPPDRLARLLGHYFEAMTAAIHSADGTVDKYIGDAVMAIWNAPTPCANHAVKACQAALVCTEATRKLFASPKWEGMPALVTRFGLHRDDVMVGHFGAPDRMSFTAMGDGVNLAARLEGLNKQYGTNILVSEAIHSEAKAMFAFRQVDRVAVKGRSKGIDVYELLGVADVSGPRVFRAQTYERALAAYFARDFGGALAALRNQLDDGPSAVLADRCGKWLANPPPADWDGTHIASKK